MQQFETLFTAVWEKKKEEPESSQQRGFLAGISCRLLFSPGEYSSHCATLVIYAFTTSSYQPVCSRVFVIVLCSTSQQIRIEKPLVTPKHLPHPLVSFIQDQTSTWAPLQVSAKSWGRQKTDQRESPTSLATGQGGVDIVTSRFRGLRRTTTAAAAADRLIIFMPK